MNPSSEEDRIREMLQRLKSAERERAPGFEEILNRPAPTMTSRPPYGRWTIVGCAAALLLGTFLLIRFQQHDADIATDTNHDSNDQGSPVESPQIDFDRLRQVVHDHYHASETTDFSQLPLWTSRTESLLALGEDMPISQE